MSIFYCKVRVGTIGSKTSVTQSPCQPLDRPHTHFPTMLGHFPHRHPAILSSMVTATSKRSILLHIFQHHLLVLSVQLFLDIPHIHFISTPQNFVSVVHPDGFFKLLTSPDLSLTRHKDSISSAILRPSTKCTKCT